MKRTSPEEIEAAIAGVIAFLQRSWSSDAGLQLRRLLWSFWNSEHFVNCHNMGRCFDDSRCEHAITLFTAYFRGELKEDKIRRMLTESGEFARWDEARIKASGCAPDYPPLPEVLREQATRYQTTSAE